MDRAGRAKVKPAEATIRKSSVSLMLRHPFMYLLHVLPEYPDGFIA
jgi:hypothetical protein